MQIRGSNLLSTRRHLTEVTVAALTASTIAVITSWFGWPGTVAGVAFSAMVTTTIQTIYKGYVDRVARVVLIADRPAPPPLSPLADRPAPPPLGPLCKRLLKDDDRLSIEVFNSEWSRAPSAWVSSPRLSLDWAVTSPVIFGILIALREALVRLRRPSFPLLIRFARDECRR